MDPSAPRPLEEGVEGEAGGAVDAAVEEDAEDEKRVAIETLHRYEACTYCVLLDATQISSRYNNNKQQKILGIISRGQ